MKKNFFSSKTHFPLNRFYVLLRNPRELWKMFTVVNMFTFSNTCSNQHQCKSHKGFNNLNSILCVWWNSEKIWKEQIRINFYDDSRVKIDLTRFRFINFSFWWNFDNFLWWWWSKPISSWVRKHQIRKSF